MILRLLLTLLLVLPAGLSAGQHRDCGTAPDAAALDHSAPGHHAAGAGQHERHGEHGDRAAAVQPADDCASCDLGCKVSCAAVALPLTVFQGASAPNDPIVHDPAVAGLLEPHPLPLLRPPASAPA